MASRELLVETEYWVLRYRRGQKDALEKLVQLWERPLYYYVRRLVVAQDEAGDLAQEIWVKVILKLKTLRDPAAFPAWLYRLARRHVLSHLRKTRPAELPEEVHADNGLNAAAEDDLSSRLNAEEVHWGLGQLSLVHRDCLTLHFLEGFSLEEISRITGVPAGTVKSRMHYAKEALREVVEKARECQEQR